MAPERPRLRAVEAFPLEHRGRRLVALRDPAGVAERILTVAAEAAPLLVRLDGAHTLDDLLGAHFRETGTLLSRDEVTQLIEVLDREHFLDSEAYARRRSALTEAYRRAPHRAPAHAGVSYPADRARLDARLAALETEADSICWGPLAGDGAPNLSAAGSDGLGTPARRPGMKRSVPRAGVSRARPELPTRPSHEAELVAIVAPHIDLRVGGATYVPAYRTLAAAGGADVAVVLGVGHTGVPELFAAGTLDVATPLGVTTTDRAFVADLSAAYGEDLTADELLHRSDHTVEFQVLFLQRFLGVHCRVVPLLASFGYEDAEGPSAERIARLSAALERVVAARRAAGERVVLVVSADLAHVGPRYGDPAAFDDAALVEVERADRALLETVAAGDADAFLAGMSAQRDRFRVCGFSPLYTGLRAAGARRGRLLAYGRGSTDGAGSVCSYASMALYA